MKRPRSIEITPGIINNIITPYYTNADLEKDNAYFNVFMLYVIFPMLYIIFTTGSLQAIIMMFTFIKNGVFDAVNGVKQFLTNTLIYALRMFGCYTFSTYIVVKDGREVFSATSDYFFMKSTRENIKRVDQAKYRVCKWIDNECRNYCMINSDDPVLNDKHNDIYDFIIHKCDNQMRGRIHRGDFRISTHTSLYENYRIFYKSYQLSNIAELHVSLDSAKTEVIFIDLMAPFHFYVEKNVVLDKAFLRWYLYNKLGRKDLADYIGQPDSKYTVNVYYDDCMNDKINPNRMPRALSMLMKATSASETGTIEQPESRNIVYTLSNGEYMLVGERYVVKVDPILHCPIFESGDKNVFHIDDVLANYYSDSSITDTDDGSDTDTETDAETDTDTDAETDAETDTDTDADTDADAETDTETEVKTQAPLDPEFEIIEPVSNAP